MNKTTRFTQRLMAIVTLMAFTIGCYAAEVVFKIVEYNKTTDEYILAASGRVPKNSWAYFENEYGATTGNRYNQIPRNRKATLYLEGWQGCKVNSVTLSLCSNNKAGQLGLSVVDGETPLYNERPSDFASEAWFGQWVSKDLHVYVDVNKPMDIPAFSDEEGSIVLQGGTSEGSVYVDAITIEYDEVPGSALEAPLGWIYEKLTSKSTLNVGDEVMIYRNGCAATDIDGMETAHYLDAMPLASTADVYDPNVLCFTLGKDDGQKQWTLTDQYGRALGATGKQALAWDEGSTLWQIDLGYDGASITNARSQYGTLRYNTPVESYARFNVYTSTSLPLPFLYRKKQQKQPVKATSLTFDETSMTVGLQEGHIALRPTLLPATTTDKRIVWTSDNDMVATVNGGFVVLKGAGQALITAATHDGGAEATISLTVTHNTDGINQVKDEGRHGKTSKVLEGRHIVITHDSERYGIDGKRMK